MKKRGLIERLVEIRKFKLRSEISSLKSRVAALNHVEQLRGKARSAAAEAIDSGTALGDLGLLGEARLANGRQAGRLKQEVATAGKKVNHAKKLHDSAHEIHREIRSRQSASRELAFELEAENFAAWRTSTEPKR